MAVIRHKDSQNRRDKSRFMNRRTDKWQIVTRTPQPLNHRHARAAINGKIYVIGRANFGVVASRLLSRICAIPSL
jgi:hypothetical protein